jgi:ubiquinol-cytochrome c reductase cytochrome b subunit
MSRPSRLKKLSTWIDERTGVTDLWRGALDEPIRGGARWAYVFGSALAFLFALQVITGMLLSIYYVPSADHAHASVAFIQKVISGGALFRGLHAYGASAMIVLLVAHIAQTFLFGAYKQRRELVWVVGGLLLLLVLAFAFTGYLLPWDQEAYFATKVGVSIAGEVPVIGPAQRRVMLGGSDLTSLTLSRFYMVHVLLLPVLLGFLIVVHVYLFRRAKPAGPFHNRNDRRVDRFFPKQLLKDSIVALTIFGVLLALAKCFPARLGPEADPTSDFLARPPWYFLPLFELLKYFPGKLSLIPTVLLPGALFALIFLLPFFDRKAERNPLRRPIATAVFVFILVGTVSLGVLAKYQDRRNPVFDAKLKRQDEEARAFLKSPFQPQDIGSASKPGQQKESGTSPDPIEPPAAFAQNLCATCHGDHGQGGKIGPRLVGVTSKPNRSKENLLKLLENTRAYGLKDPMPASFPKLSPEDRVKIVEWLDSLKPR